MFAQEAADVAMEAIKNGVARLDLDWDTVYNKTLEDIKKTRSTIDMMIKNDLIKTPDNSMLEKALKTAIDSVK